METENTQPKTDRFAFAKQLEQDLEMNNLDLNLDIMPLTTL